MLFERSANASGKPPFAAENPAVISSTGSNFDPIFGIKCYFPMNQGIFSGALLEKERELTCLNHQPKSSKSSCISDEIGNTGKTPTRKHQVD